MREKFKLSIKFCGTGQFRLPGQNRWAGWPTRGWLVFCSSPRLPRRDTKLHCHLSGLGTVKTNYRDPWLFTHLSGLGKNICQTWHPSLPLGAGWRQLN